MKLTIKITIDMRNAAFASLDGPKDIHVDASARAGEAARILSELAGGFLVGGGIYRPDSGPLTDINGNTVGQWEVTDK